MEGALVFVAILVVVILFVFVVTVATALQAARLKSTADSLQKQVFGAHIRYSTSNKNRDNENETARRRGFAVMRAYALILRATESYRLNDLFPRAAFVDEDLRVCRGTNMLQNVTVMYDDPVWILIDKKRSSDVFVHDIGQGVVKHIGLNGMPCRVRLPTFAEQEEINVVQPKAHPKAQNGYHALLVASTLHATPTSDGEEGTCNSLQNRMYSFRMENDDEPWRSTLKRLYLREQGANVASTSLHVFGYSLL